MDEEEILKQAKIDVSNLVDQIVEEVRSTAYLYNYEPGWVMQEFKNQLSRIEI